MKPTSIINWAAWIIFLVSLFLPMEHNTISGPCDWPCTPFVTTVAENAFFFAFSPVFLAFQFLAWNGMRTYLVAVTYTLLGLGEILILLTPFMEKKISSPFRQKLHSSLAVAAVLAILYYGLDPNICTGVDPLRNGYYAMASAFLLVALASLLRFIKARRSESSGS
jgi:hypothetical protein